MAEWSNAAVLKTVEGHTSGGSNPSSSAEQTRNSLLRVLYFTYLKNRPLNGIKVDQYVKDFSLLVDLFERCL